MPRTKAKIGNAESSGYAAGFQEEESFQETLLRSQWKTTLRGFTESPWIDTYGNAKNQTRDENFTAWILLRLQDFTCTVWQLLQGKSHRQSHFKKSPV